MNLQNLNKGVQNNAIDSLFCCGDAADKMAKVTSSKIRSNVWFYARPKSNLLPQRFH